MRVLVSVVIGLIGLASIAEAAEPGGDWIARVKRVAGEAYVEAGGTKAPLRVGDRLGVNAVVMTGANSGAGITFRDNTRASVGPNARLVLARYAFEPGDSLTNPELEANLEVGAAAFVSGRVTERAPGAMRVRTPAALLGVRGTTFLAVTGEPLDR